MVVKANFSYSQGINELNDVDRLYVELLSQEKSKDQRKQIIKNAFFVDLVLHHDLENKGKTKVIAGEKVYAAQKSLSSWNWPHNLLQPVAAGVGLGVTGGILDKNRTKVLVGNKFLTFGQNNP